MALSHLLVPPPELHCKQLVMPSWIHWESHAAQAVRHSEGNGLVAASHGMGMGMGMKQAVQARLCATSDHPLVQEPFWTTI